jgi:hypothetical protein
MEWAKWEDYGAGLYNSVLRADKVQQSLQLLADPDAFYEAAREMIREWRRAARHNLGHLVASRRSWIGQATCCYVHGASAAETRAAWGELSLDQQRRANASADALIEQYERGWLNAETLFEH